ncbi:NAD-dependent epimerase/dehydratase family protein [Kribbella solani]|uniref:NAD-dependent epimerase/dehydratase family protein n=1 Tax=Kribbella solani TaxID=236067 RepID=UPI0029B8D81F|nr:NAD(P)-dependent oxidoreductase [Kribbella solani]MDX2972183.1 NAD(P)-dependent oxidoreductase [Kribbella solani]
MRALILGAGGFIGSHLAVRLVNSGWQVTCLVRSRPEPAVLRRLADVSEELDIVCGDACDADVVGSLVTSVDAVFAMTGPGFSSSPFPLDLYQSLTAQLKPTLTLLQVLQRRRSQARVVLPGSRLQYGAVGGGPIDEYRRLEPISWYALCKTLEENLALMYGRIHDINVCCLRISPVFGQFDDMAKRQFGVIGRFVELAARDDAIPLFGGGSQMRDFVYIEDLTRAIELASTVEEARGQVFNIGGPAPVSLRAVADTIVELLGRGRVAHAPWPPNAEREETGDYWADTSKAGRLLGWRPEIELREGLRILLSG